MPRMNFSSINLNLGRNAGVSSMFLDNVEEKVVYKDREKVVYKDREKVVYKDREKVVYKDREKVVYRDKVEPWKDVYGEDLEAKTGEKVCSICITNEPKCILLPCMHSGFCIACSNALCITKRCPICRSIIHTPKKIFDNSEINE